jgi:flagellar motility protein MotE (MotC chaperone)
MANKNDKTADLSAPQDIAEKPEKIKVKKEKKDKRKRKKRFPLVPVLVLLIIIGGIVAVIVLNLFGLRDRIMSYMHSAPLIGQYFPAPTEAATGPVSEYAGMAPEEIESIVTALELQIERLEANIQTAQEQHTDDLSTINNLRQYESQIENYRALKQALDVVIANGDPSGYAEYFESVSPENAAEIYAEIMNGLQYNAEERKIASTYAEMKADAAAEGLQAMLAPNADMVVRILKNMDPRNRAEIWNEFEPANLAIITQLMYPEEPTTEGVTVAPLEPVE